MGMGIVCTSGATILVVGYKAGFVGGWRVDVGVVLLGWDGGSH